MASGDGFPDEGFLAHCLCLTLQSLHLTVEVWPPPLRSPPEGVPGAAAWREGVKSLPAHAGSETQHSLVRDQDCPATTLLLPLGSYVTLGKWLKLSVL